MAHSLAHFLNNYVNENSSTDRWFIVMETKIDKTGKYFAQYHSKWCQTMHMP